MLLVIKAWSQHTILWSYSDKKTHLKIFLQPFIHVNWLQDSIVYIEEILCTDGNDMKRSHIKATKINNQVQHMILYVRFMYRKRLNE